VVAVFDSRQATNVKVKVTYIGQWWQVLQHCLHYVSVTSCSSFHQTVGMMPHHQRTKHLLQSGVSHCTVVNALHLPLI